MVVASFRCLLPVFVHLYLTSEQEPSKGNLIHVPQYVAEASCLRLKKLPVDDGASRAHADL